MQAWSGIGFHLTMIPDIVIATIPLFLAWALLSVTSIIFVFFINIGQLQFAAGVVMGQIAFALGFSSFTRGYFKTWLDYMVSAGMYIVVAAIRTRLVTHSMVDAVHDAAALGLTTSGAAAQVFDLAFFVFLVSFEIPKIAGMFGGGANASGAVIGKIARSAAGAAGMTMHAPMTAEVLMKQHERRVDLIAQCANEVSKGDFERRWLSVLRGCAAVFSSLPLSPDLYREPGGAFRCTVETAFYAMRLAGGQKFGTNLPSERRRRVEPQYNYAVFLAAVCSRLDEPYRHFSMERDKDQQAWNPSVHGAAGVWLGGSEYRVLRRAQPLPVERMRTGMLAQILVGSGLLSELDGEVQAELFGGSTRACSRSELSPFYTRLSGRV